MPIARYGVFKGRPIARILGAGQNPHYQIHVVDSTTDERIAVNVKSKKEPSELLYAIDEDLQHPITALLRGLPEGFTALPSQPGGAALDYIRGNFVDRRRMVPMPFADAGPGDDLYDRLEALVVRAMGDGEATVYAFGASWYGEAIKDKYFGFHPGAGVHDAHMNQGNDPTFAKDDGVWQDGGLIFNIRRADGYWQWIAVFLAFQSQSWSTDDVNGHAIERDSAGVGDVRLVAATLEPVKESGKEAAGSSITIVNASERAVALEGWGLVNYAGVRSALAGALAAGEARTLPLELRLGKNGDTLTLVDAVGRRIDGVAYGKSQVPKPGRLLVFR